MLASFSKSTSLRVIFTFALTSASFGSYSDTHACFYSDIQKKKILIIIISLSFCLLKYSFYLYLLSAHAHV